MSLLKLGIPHGEIPNVDSNVLKEICQVILMMLEEDPAQRKDASELLANKIFIKSENELFQATPEKKMDADSSSEKENSHAPKKNTKAMKHKKSNLLKEKGRDALGNISNVHKM